MGRIPMPPPFVNIIREEIYYEYAKLISRSAYHSLQRAFITDRFKKLRTIHENTGTLDNISKDRIIEL